MKIPTWLSSLAILGLAVLGAGNAAAQATNPGPFSLDQVNAGRQGFATSCAECHNSDLSGANGPALVGKDFLAHWQGRTAQDFYKYVQSTMPVCNGGLLGNSAYLEIVSFLLWANGAEPGKDDLSADTAVKISDFVSGTPRPGLPGK